MSNGGSKLVNGLTVVHKCSENSLLLLGFEPWPPVSNTGTLATIPKLLKFSLRIITYERIVWCQVIRFYLFEPFSVAMVSSE